MSQDTLSLRIDSRTWTELEALAATLGRSPEELAGEALNELIERHRWQVARIREGIAAADAGDFATDEEMVDAVALWHR